MKRIVSLAAVVLFASAGCTTSSQKQDIQSGKSAMAAGNSSLAVAYFDRAAHGEDQQLSLEAARPAARLAYLELKNYPKAIEYNRIIIVASDNDTERKAAQKTIAQIYFENLLDYQQAILEYEKLLQLEFTPEEKFQFRFNIAKSQLQIGHIDQAMAELADLEKGKGAEDYDLQLFKSNILISQKRQQDAALILETLVKKFPERSEKESLGLTLAVCYEEAEDFKKAIEALEAMKKGYSHPEFLDTRIARLRARMKNMPGANGLKK